MTMDLFREELFKKATEKGFTDFEMSYLLGDTLDIDVFNGSVDSYTDASTVTIDFRGTFNGKMGYATTEKLEADAIDFLLEEAKNNANILETTEESLIFEGSKTYPTLETYNKELEELDIESIIEMLITLEAKVKSLDSRVKNVVYYTFKKIISQNGVANSKDVNVDQAVSQLVIYMSISVEENGQVKSFSDFWYANELERFDVDTFANNIVNKAIRKLRSSSMQSGKYPIVFENRAFASLLDTFSPIFSGEMVVKKLSLLEGKIDTAIANEKVTIIDDPWLEGGLSSTAFDSEGVATFTKPVIKDGVLATYLHTLHSAKMLEAVPTGNGFKSASASKVDVAPTNLYLQGGELSKEALIKDIETGVLITSLSGLHAGANVISGDFSLLSEGFLIENGEITRPIEQITIAGNFFEVLRNIETIGNDLSFILDAVGSPSVRVKPMSISGE